MPDNSSILNSDVWFYLLSGVVGSILLLAYQIWRDRTERKAIEIMRKNDRKRSIISDVIAHRYVLAGRLNARGVAAFNAALNRIPIEFIDAKDVLDRYRDIGNGFTSQKYYELVMAMVKSTTDVAEGFDKHLLENVPSVTKDIPEFNILIKGENLDASIQHASAPTE